MKNLGKLAALVAFAGSIAPVAFAQSSVTAYGVMDLGVNRTSNVNGGSITGVRSGNTLSSRIGFRGREDMGGGLTALFNVESTISADTGATGAVFWNRQSWVAIAKQNLGQVTLGLQLPVVSDAVVSSVNASYFGNQAAAIDGAAQAAGSAAARFNNLIGGARVTNAVKVTSASFAGLRVAAMTALGEGSTGRGDSVGLIYSGAAFDGGIAVHQTGCVSSVCAKDKVTVVGGSYKPGQGIRVGAIWTRETNARNVNRNDADTLSFLLLYPVGPWTYMAGYQALNDKSTLNQDVKQLNLGVKHLLSKRTELYALYSNQSVDNRGRAGMYSELSSNDKQNQYNVGLRHSF